MKKRKRKYEKKKIHEKLMAKKGKFRMRRTEDSRSKKKHTQNYNTKPLKVYKKITTTFRRMNRNGTKFVYNMNICCICVCVCVWYENE